MILVSFHSDLGQVSKEAPKEIVLTITGCTGQARLIVLAKKTSKASLLQRCWCMSAEMWTGWHEWRNTECKHELCEGRINEMG